MICIKDYYFGEVKKDVIFMKMFVMEAILAYFAKIMTRIFAHRLLVKPLYFLMIVHFQKCYILV